MDINCAAKFILKSARAQLMHFFIKTWHSPMTPESSPGSSLQSHLPAPEGAATVLIPSLRDSVCLGWNSVYRDTSSGVPFQMFSFLIFEMNPCWCLYW